MPREPNKRRAVQVSVARSRPRGSRLVALARSRRAAWACLVVLGLAGATVALSVWARASSPIAVGRVAVRTHVVRTPFETVDQSATRAAREQARRRTPRVYLLQQEAIQGIRAGLLNLPVALAQTQNVDELGERARTTLELEQEHLDALRGMASQGEPIEQWVRMVDRVIEVIHVSPMLDGTTWTDESLHGARGEKWIELRNGRPRRVPDSATINLGADPAQVRRAIDDLVARAGVRGPLADAMAKWLAADPVPTHELDTALTERARDSAADRVAPVRRQIPEGAIIALRGEVIDADDARMIMAERRATAEASRGWRARLALIGVGAASVIIVGAGMGYVSLFCPRIRGSTPRTAWIGALMLGAIGVAIVGSIAQPGLVAATSMAPIIFVAIIVAIAYDPRTSLALSALAGLIVAISLGHSAVRYALLIGALGAAIVPLRDVRDRNSLINTGLLVAGVLGLGTALASVIEGPVSPALIRQSVTDAVLAAVAGLVVGGLTMFVLPTIERVFDITTGMTLIELRDPKQPLLRELQQRAPGTYNHSLNVASIAEAAADAIGANALLTYVGALYHDIGKMNKPEYFVENQAGGPNKHDKLRPAMSLLVIVGHVKDGVELAREAELPRQIIQFIEGHHGTTLVEYFYRRAKIAANQPADTPAAESPTRDAPEEFDYRYPGPKPQTREVAILMLADAVESATRTLPEPTPSRIDTLVRQLANKRLLDGQFDECGLTLQELNTIVESISKTVSSIYHGRLAYTASTETRSAEPATAGPSRGSV